jgi:hypothetical protein|tara:strand:- start:59 stop:652 length:594 start_codon:yes stop_codon:yes gene_type:complete
MCLRHFKNFDFHCITEDPEKNIDKNINIIPLPKGNLEKWWWKMWLFNEEWLTLDNCVFFDLDIIIQDHLTIEYDENVKLLYTDWVDCEQMRQDVLCKHYQYCDINSSIISWNKNTKRHHIWEDFQKNQEMITFLFHGIDNYINYRHKESYSPYKNNTAYSYSTNDQHRADCPIILFDYIQNKQDTLMHIDWVKKLWN